MLIFWAMFEGSLYFAKKTSDPYLHSLLHKGILFEFSVLKYIPEYVVNVQINKAGSHLVHLYSWHSISMKVTQDKCKLGLWVHGYSDAFKMS